MKKIFTIALVALATVWAVSCDKDDKDDKINLVGTSWEMNFSGNVMGMDISMDEILNFTTETEGNRHVEASYGGNSIVNDTAITYTWDGTSLGVAIDDVVRTLTYRESDNTFYMPLEGDDEMATIAQLLGINELVYHQIK